ncbi:hypothetical protein DdX_06510 [Ditylenchus destructor]|uniref:Uncharacterized protein n=1 Tax=Ditylenchus destructor TaxID=166010 RepID=A0AAD4N7Y8_9BILA|nr:hypothetical protein DdX_06510 [Ditylenchus destructor]
MSGIQKLLNISLLVCCLTFYLNGISANVKKIKIEVKGHLKCGEHDIPAAVIKIFALHEKERTQIGVVHYHKAAQKKDLLGSVPLKDHPGTEVKPGTRVELEIFSKSPKPECVVTAKPEYRKLEESTHNSFKIEHGQKTNQGIKLELKGHLKCGHSNIPAAVIKVFERKKDGSKHLLGSIHWRRSVSETTLGELYQHEKPEGDIDLEIVTKGGGTGCTVTHDITHRKLSHVKYNEYKIDLGVEDVKQAHIILEGNLVCDGKDIPAAVITVFEHKNHDNKHQIQKIHWRRSATGTVLGNLHLDEAPKGEIELEIVTKSGHTGCTVTCDIPHLKPTHENNAFKINLGKKDVRNKHISEKKNDKAAHPGAKKSSKENDDVNVKHKLDHLPQGKIVHSPKENQNTNQHHPASHNAAGKVQSKKAKRKQEAAERKQKMIKEWEEKYTDYYKITEKLADHVQHNNAKRRHEYGKEVEEQFQKMFNEEGTNVKDKGKIEHLGGKLLKILKTGESQFKQLPKPMQNDHGHKEVLAKIKESRKDLLQACNDHKPERIILGKSNKEKH